MYGVRNMRNEIAIGLVSSSSISTFSILYLLNHKEHILQRSNDNEELGIMIGVSILAGLFIFRVAKYIEEYRRKKNGK